MRQVYMLAFLLPSFLSFGQKGDKLFYAVHLYPEKTYYHDNYYSQNSDYNSKSTFNYGIGSAVHYDLTKNLFVETGIDFIRRKFITKVNLEQSELPPPRQSFISVAVQLNSVSLRMLEFPLNIGFRFMPNEKMNLYLITGISSNLLLNSYYNAIYFTGFEGTYWKFYWNGYSVNVGGGSDYKISKNCFLIARLAYSAINSVNVDKYLGNEGHPGNTLTHEFLYFTLGVNVSYKYLDTLLLRRKYKQLEKVKKCPVYR